MRNTPKSCDECKYLYGCNSAHGEKGCYHEQRGTIKKLKK